MRQYTSLFVLSLLGLSVHGTQSVKQNLAQQKAFVQGNEYHVNFGLDLNGLEGGCSDDSSSQPVEVEGGCESSDPNVLVIEFNNEAAFGGDSCCSESPVDTCNEPTQQ